MSHILNSLLESPTNFKFKQFNRHLSNSLLGDERECLDATVSIGRVLGNSNLFKYKGYGDVIDQVWMNRQQIDPKEIENFLKMVLFAYPKLEIDIVRMQSLIFIRNVLPLEKTVETFLALGETQLSEGLPVGEIVWELNAVMKQNITKNMNAVIHSFIKKCTSE